MSTLSKSYWPAHEELPLLDLTAGGLLAECAADSPDTVALVEVLPRGSDPAERPERRSWTYAELYRDAQRCAGFLAERFAPGERITVWAPNSPEWVIAQFGASFAGLILVTANPALRPDELRYVLDQSDSSALLYVPAFRGSDMSAIAQTAAQAANRSPELIDISQWATLVRDWPAPQALPTVSPVAAAQIQYTSGTTGQPKGALLHHQGLVNNARYMVTRAGAPQGAKVVSAMPLFHAAGCGLTILGTACLRGTVFLQSIFDPGQMLDVIEQDRCELVHGVPTMFVAMLEDPSFAGRDLSSCQVGVTGGASVPEALAAKIEQTFGMSLSTIYGQTEMSGVLTQTAGADDEADRRHTAGRPLAAVEVKIADHAGAAVPIGTEGEVCSRGYQNMLEYFRMPEQTSHTIDADGWLHSGDLGTMDERGYLRITGRLKDMIIRGGENVYPREIEEVLYTHPAIAQAVVVGLPDARWGEIIAAVVIVRANESVTATQLHDYCRERLAPHKTPVEWYAATELPMTGSGKLQKFRIVEHIADSRFTPLTD